MNWILRCPHLQEKKISEIVWIKHFDVHESVHRDTIMKVTNKMQLYRLIYYSKSALQLLNENKTKYMTCTRKRYRENKLEIDNMSFESVQSFKYLGSTVNQNNKIEEEIKERIIAGNRAFYANQKMFQKQIIIKEI